MIGSLKGGYYSDQTCVRAAELIIIISIIVSAVCDAITAHYSTLTPAPPPAARASHFSGCGNLVQCAG